MSYMSGFMMGATMGKNLHDLFIKGNMRHSVQRHSCQTERESFALIHALPGRRRYRALGLLGNEALAILLERQLLQLQFIDYVKASPVTGSLLLVYSGTEYELDGIAVWLESHIFFATALPQQERIGLAKSGKSIRRTTGTMNEWLKGHSDDWLDLNSVLSIFFIVRGLRKVLFFHQRPSGPQMIWWAVSLLRGWRMT